MDVCDNSEDDSPHEISVFVDVPEDHLLGSSDKHREVELNKAAIDQVLVAVRYTLDHHSQSPGTISIRLVSDDAIARLHERTMNISGPTDVLTFDLSDEQSDHEDGEAHRVEGDIVISLDTAAREATNRQHALTHELMLYAIHATLHLLGFDDRNESDAAGMHAEEDKILTALGVGAVYGRPVN